MGQGVRGGTGDSEGVVTGETGELEEEWRGGESEVGKGGQRWDRGIGGGTGAPEKDGESRDGTGWSEMGQGIRKIWGLRDETGALKEGQGGVRKGWGTRNGTGASEEEQGGQRED